MERVCTATVSRWVIPSIVKDKKLILFGTGRKAKEFLFFHKGHIPVTAVIDNDVNKHNLKLGDVIEDLNNPINENLIINSVDILSKYDDDEILIFIANAHPEEMIRQITLLRKTHVVTFAQWYQRQAQVSLAQKINNNKIIFFMYMHGAHEKAITRQLLKYRPDLDIVWVVDRCREDVPSGVRVLSTEYLYDCKYEADSAKVWVTGLEILNDYFKKRNGQHYIQVKHWASLTLKVFGPKCNERVVSNEEYEHILKAYEANNNKMDVVFTGSAFDEKSCRNGWGYLGHFVRVGSPRSDIMFDKAAGKRVYESIGIDESVNLAVYAPTFRWPFTREQPFSSLNFAQLYKSLIKRFGGKWRILLRLHPLVAEEAAKMTLPPYVLNVSDYDDSEELMAASTITITDYSSIMFEPAFVYKPVFLYAPDKEQYQREHPLLLEYDKMPFPVCDNNDDLEHAILNFDESEYRIALKNMFEKYEVDEDGRASERAAMYILGLMDSNRR